MRAPPDSATRQRKGMTMTRSKTIPPASDLKDQARRLRQALAQQGSEITHSKSLELLARQFGVRDWNTLVAQAGNGLSPQLPQVGDTVRGRYMGHPFTGTLKSLAGVSGKGTWRVTIHLDEPVDVVSFDSFSALRRRISGTIGQNGRSVQRRSDGTPHLELDWPDV